VLPSCLATEHASDLSLSLTVRLHVRQSAVVLTACLRMYRFGEHSDLQKTVLRKQVAIARELALPLVIHSRDSELDIIEELKQVNYNKHIAIFANILFIWVAVDHLTPLVLCDKSA